MRKRLAIIMLLLAVSLIAFWPNEAAACGPKIITDYSIATKDYKFVMLMSKSSATNPVFYNNELRAIYPSSGMYKNDTSKTLLWKVDWYADGFGGSYDVAVSADGQHVVRRGFGIDGDALFFYLSGREVKKYTASNLGVTSDKLKPEPCGYRYALKKYELDDVNKRVNVETLVGDKYVFNLQGDLIEGSLQIDTGPPVAWFFIVVIALLLLLLIIGLVRGRFGTR